MDPIHALAMPQRDTEAMREALYTLFADDTVIQRIRRSRVAAVVPSGIRRPRRRPLTVALAR